MIPCARIQHMERMNAFTLCSHNLLWASFHLIITKLLSNYKYNNAIKISEATLVLYKEQAIFYAQKSMTAYPSS